MLKGKVLTLLIAFCLSLFFLLLFRIYYHRIAAFGCFDDCFNITAGYFILKGKTLYSEVFFNHQPLMAYISYLIQAFFNPQTLYKLILYHRLFIFAFSLLMDILLIARFRFVGVGFVLLYEATKYYLFGDRFLAESIIVYPLVYLLGLLWYKLTQKRIFPWELILGAIFTWFVVFMREPFIPVALFLYGLILWGKRFDKRRIFDKGKFLSLSIFTFLSLFTILLFPFSDYLFNVVGINASVEVKAQEFFGLGLLKIFAYPLYIFLSGGEWSFLRFILAGLSLVFLILLISFSFRLKKVKWALLILLILGLSNLRVVAPGTMFYEAFHLAPWYGLFIMTILLLLKELYRHKNSRVLVSIPTSLLIIILGFAILNPASFIWEKMDKNWEFTTNYGHYFVTGEVVKRLSLPSDTLFVDGFDELIHWQADLPSSYKYSWYTSVMPYFSLYTAAREEMFKNNPPDFYYGTCPGDVNAQRLMPEEVMADYTQLYFSERPTCLYVRKTKLSTITQGQWEKAEELGFYSK